MGLAKSKKPSLGKALVKSRFTKQKVDYKRQDGVTLHHTDFVELEANNQSITQQSDLNELLYDIAIDKDQLVVKPEYHTKEVEGYDDSYAAQYMDDVESVVSEATRATRGLEYEAPNDTLSIITTHNIDYEAVISKETERAKEFNHLLVIPKRPAWTVDTTKEQLEVNEQTAFLEWRRGLVGYVFFHTSWFPGSR